MKLLIKAIALFLTVALAIALPSVFFSREPADTAESVSLASYNSPEPPVETFILQAYDGGIGIFSSLSGDDPITVVNINTSTMRAVDRDMFERGITVSSYEEVLRLLEDFNS